MSSTPATRLIRRASSFTILSVLMLAAMAYCAPAVEPVPEPQGLKLEESPAPPLLPPVPAQAAGVPAKDLDFRALAEFVAATSFEDFGNSTEGTVLAHFDDLDKDRDPAHVWVVEKGALRDGSTKDLDRAFGNNKRKWPPYTLVFGVSQGEEGRYEVVVKTWYDMGLFPDSRGGMAQLWHVAKQDGGWVLVDGQTTMNWD